MRDESSATYSSQAQRRRTLYVPSTWPRAVIAVRKTSRSEVNLFKSLTLSVESDDFDAIDLGWNRCTESKRCVLNLSEMIFRAGA